VLRGAVVARHPAPAAGGGAARAGARVTTARLWARRLEWGLSGRQRSREVKVVGVAACLASNRHGARCGAFGLPCKTQEASRHVTRCSARPHMPLPRPTRLHTHLLQAPLEDGRHLVPIEAHDEARGSRVCSCAAWGRRARGGAQRANRLPRATRRSPRGRRTD
jgi:hypothetical protein